tara:strand:- start:12226 stop:13005 length:780 start_codon:yes stop_codon:yes gene_type:complete
MAKRTVKVNATRADMIAKIYRAVGILSGRLPDKSNVARGFRIALGFAVLTDVKDAFTVKMRGGTDEMGIKWPPLDPATIANRRVGPKDIKRDPAIAERESIRKSDLAKIVTRLSLTMPAAEAYAKARNFAGRSATMRTGRTKEQTLGGRDVEILRDTSVLLNSLSPGSLNGVGPDASRTPPRGKGSDQQIFDLSLPRSIVVGSSVAYAAAHNDPAATSHIPQRKFLPTDGSDIPAVWWDRWLKFSGLAAVMGIERLVKP